MIDSGPPPGSKVSKFAFRYGRVQARIRVPAGRGLWSALWLLPANRSDLPEIDGFEILGRNPRAVQMHLHYRDPGGSEAVKGLTWGPLRPAGGWHRYELDWSPGRLRWLIDGVPRWQVTGATVPSTPMYVIADLAVGGGPAGAPGPGTPFPSSLQIDWIRITR
jgi:beta-glucanase (GH16 family)